MGGPPHSLTLESGSQAKRCRERSWAVGFSLSSTLPGYVTSGTPLNFSEPQLPRRDNGTVTATSRGHRDTRFLFRAFCVAGVLSQPPLRQPLANPQGQAGLPFLSEGLMAAEAFLYFVHVQICLFKTTDGSDYTFLAPSMRSLF